MKTLIIAEKPSVATDIARVLGGMKKNGDYYEGEHYVVGNAVGHLLELSCPEKYEVKRGKWSLANLPVLPPTFDLKPIARNAEKLKSLKKLINRDDIGLIINACDAGREGELIFRYIMQATKAKQPIKRLWLQSMTPDSIRHAFENLRSDEEMQPLAAAARCRSESDWLVGINSTRAMTAFNSTGGGFFLTTVGRVQTPTLGIVVRREKEIRKFKPRDYWEVKSVFALSNGTYEGRWFNPSFKKDPTAPELKAERIFAQAEAQAIVDRCQGQIGQIEETCKRTTQSSPLLFDLTSLQREANARFGLSASTTLSLAQELYEKHKVLTYPRTDSRALPEDYLPTVEATLGQLSNLQEYEAFAQRILSTSGWLKKSPRIFDNKKISDHFAIIPTTLTPKVELGDLQRKIYDLVVRRFMAVFFPPAQYDVTTRITTIDQDHFKTEGKVLVEPGWLAIYGKSAASTDASLLLGLNGQTSAQAIEVRLEQNQTKPPARYTEATLLSAMEGAGKLVEDDELRQAMAEKGLGTPATRSNIIENLVDQGYMQRHERELVPTAKAFQLFSLLEGLKINDLSDPKLTGEWEYQLGLIEKGQLSAKEFMDRIRTMTTRIVQATKDNEGVAVQVDNPVHIKARCPMCGGEVVENYRRFACTHEGCTFSLPKHLSGHMFSVDEVERLIGTGRVGPIDDFISRMGRRFSAELRLNKEGTLEFDFGESQEVTETEDVANLPEVSRCPKCGGRLLMSNKAYACEHQLLNDGQCDFRMGRVILQKEISVEDVQKLVSTGKTDVIEGFVSARTHRPFKAHLVWLKGKVGFEFPPRETKPVNEEKGKRASRTKKE